MNYTLTSQTKCLVINGLSVALGSMLLVPFGSGKYGIAPAVDSTSNPLTYKVYDTLYSGFLLNGVAAASEAALLDWWNANAFKAEGGGSINANTQTALDGKLGLETVATFAAVSSATNKRLIIVIADETQGGSSGFYIHDGTKLNWVVTQ